MHLEWPSLATSQSHELAWDWQVLTLAGLGVTVLVVALILYPLVRWRRRSDELPPQFNQNNALEITYTLLPLALVCVLFAVTFRVEADVERVAPKPDAIVEVTGYRWSWRFAYPGTGIAIAGTPQNPPQMILPLNRTAQLVVASDDVDHSFWIPDFLFKRDAIPGIRNVFDLHPTQLGTFRGECAEYCGLQHAGMSFAVKVVSPDAYGRWIASKGRAHV